MLKSPITTGILHLVCFDLDTVYKPPILHQHVNHSNDIHHMMTRNSDDKVQEPGEVPPDDSSSNSSEGSAKRTVPNNSKGPVTMNCSHRQFVYLLKNLLVFHTMYKCGCWLGSLMRSELFPNRLSECCPAFR
jgi:hypothetical protein